MKTMTNNQTIITKINIVACAISLLMRFTFTPHASRLSWGAQMIASITGVGWVGTENIGWGRRYTRNLSGEDTLPKVTSRMIFGKGLPHFGRLDTYSKIGIAAIAFALKDARHLNGRRREP